MQLFQEEQYPKGFSYYPEFITIEEEKFLVSKFQELELHPFIFHGYEAKRKVISFGYDYNFSDRELKIGKPIPPEFNFLITKTADFIKIPPSAFVELLITEYPEGSVINWHRDAPPFDIIAGISLVSSCKFRLRPHDKSLQNRKSIISITVVPRSLYIIKDEARLEWEHSIPAVSTRRYSITLRTLKSS